jgi:hypothetical protein
MSRFPQLQADIPEHNEFLNWLCAAQILVELAVERGECVSFPVWPFPFRWRGAVALRFHYGACEQTDTWGCVSCGGES